LPDSPSDVPGDVRRLIADHIVSIEQLDILLLLRARPDVAWNAKEVADELRTSEWSAAGRMADLRARGLVTAEGDPIRYRFAPASDELRATLDRLAQIYTERR
jgi:predicted ArsR family transcriptional regulator